MTAVFPVVFAAIFAIAGAVRAAEGHAGRPVMGTVLQATVIAAEAGVARRLAEEAIEEARRWDDLLTTWRPQGELARLNARAGSGFVAVSPELQEALERMLALSLATAGAFDPAVGPLVELWRKDVPSPETLAKTALLRLPQALSLEPGRAALARHAALDAGAIGKGIALDAIARRLRQGGAQAAYLDFGGSSQIAIASPPGSSSGWTVAVAGVGAGEVLGTVWLRDGSLSTSRASGPGDEAGPILDPRNGRPVDAPRFATALAADATTAEAWSTALVVLGAQGLSRARDNGVEALVVDATGAHRTAGFPLRTGSPAGAPDEGHPVDVRVGP